MTTLAADFARLIRDAQNILIEAEGRSLDLERATEKLRDLLDGHRARELLSVADGIVHQRPRAIPAERAGIHD